MYLGILPPLRLYGPAPSGINHFYTNTAEQATYITDGSAAAISYTPYFTFDRS